MPEECLAVQSWGYCFTGRLHYTSTATVTGTCAFLLKFLQRFVQVCSTSPVCSLCLCSCIVCCNTLWTLTAGTRGRVFTVFSPKLKDTVVRFFSSSSPGDCWGSCLKGLWRLPSKRKRVSCLIPNRRRIDWAVEKGLICLALRRVSDGRTWIIADRALSPATGSPSLLTDNILISSATTGIWVYGSGGCLATTTRSLPPWLCMRWFYVWVHISLNNDSTIQLLPWPNHPFPPYPMHINMHIYSI